MIDLTPIITAVLTLIISLISAFLIPYIVRVTATDLYIRRGAGTNYGTNGFIKPGVYTIVEEQDGQGATKWGKLKSGAGWISLDFVQKL